MVRRLPRIDFRVVDSTVVKKCGIHLAVLVIAKAVHKEGGLLIKSLPILRIACELVGIQECDQRFALLPPFHVLVRRRLGGGTEAVDASVVLVKPVAESMVNERQASAANLGILLTPHTLRRLYDQPTGFQVKAVFRLLGVAVAIGHTPVVVKVVATVAGVRVDDLVNKDVQ